MSLKTTALRLNALRAEMSRLGLDALIVPRFDAHQGEYVAPHDARLAWLTGFTGSAGMAVITPQRAEMFVDGRYTVQVQAQCAGPDFGYHHLIETPPDRWLAEADPAWRVGYDPMLLSPNWADWMTAALGDRLVALDANPVDAVWPDQPAPPQGRVTPFPMQYAGRSSTDKRDGLLAQMAREGADFAVETQPDNIAWLLNVRGRDVDYNPIPQSFLLLSGDGQASWFIDPDKLTADLDDHLPDWITPRPVQAFLTDLAATVPAGATVLLDPDFSPAAVVLALDRIGAQARRVPGPVTLAKAIKNRVELAGMRAAHLADGVAWAEFSAALPRTLPTTEAEAEALMERLRAQQPGFVMPSFKAISAAGGNAAMCHYATGPGRDAPLTAGMTYLLDSGGQYDTGTTDATRCFAFGPVSDDYRRAYTAVFRALHAMMTLRFPPGTRGHHIDAICRRPLWDLGMDYDHGTGHGVGHQLSVHEHPQRIGRLVNAVDLVPGMILTIEPGHYVAGQYGIRIENQVEVVEEADGFMSFANLTWAPIQTDMLDLSRLTADERAWLVRYNAAILTSLGPQLSDAARDWTIANGALLE